MSGYLRIVLLLAVLLYFIVVILLLRRQLISLKYTLLWLFAGVVMLILTIFPSLLSIVSHLLGIETTMNCLFILALAAVIIIMMSITAIVSKQSDKIKTLIQYNWLLEKRVRDLEDILKNKEQ